MNKIKFTHRYLVLPESAAKSLGEFLNIDSAFNKNDISCQAYPYPDELDKKTMSKKPRRLIECRHPRAQDTSKFFLRMVISFFYDYGLSPVPNWLKPGEARAYLRTLRAAGEAKPDIKKKTGHQK